MTYDAILPGATLLLRTSPFAKPRKVKVLEKMHGRFIIVEPSAGGSFSCAPDQLSPVPEEPAKDPDGLAPGERKLLDVLSLGPLTTGQIAAVVNGNPEQESKWTASTAGMLARRLEKAGRVRVEKGGKQMVVSLI
jgi:hypothetical protein